MRWLFAPLALGLALAGSWAAAADAPQPAAPVAHGTGPAYAAFGRLPVMHSGRVKPLDTVAREEIDMIFKRENIRLLDADGRIRETWTPVAAFLDWSARPGFWDKQAIISLDYLPLKRFLFAEEAHAALEGIASKSSTPEAARKRLTDLAHFQEVNPSEIRGVVRDSGLPAEDGKELLTLAVRMGEETKHFSTDDLMGTVVTIDGKATPFPTWIGTLGERQAEARKGPMGKAPLNDVEEKALRVAEEILRYRTIRDINTPARSPFLAMPRPANDTMIAFTAAALGKLRSSGEQTLSDLESEAVESLQKYLADIPGKDRAMPGANPDFDARYKDWALERSAWVPVHVLRSASVDELVAAGFPKDKVVAYRDAWEAAEKAEKAEPGRAQPAPMDGLLASAQALGAAVNDTGYPSLAEMAREAHFNRFAPFTLAPAAYLGGFLMLALSLIASQFGRSMRLESTFRPITTALYGLGMLGFVGGIGLEVYGFYLRIAITGWAPVTNMYETVIFVALIASILGLVFELNSRLTIAAVAGTLSGLLGTALAANVPLLDPKISTLTPVLRDNFWLTIHVLTIVSSYAPFTLAMVLGLIATAVYLTATYKRSAGFGELLIPLAFGVPTLGTGVGLMILMQNQPPGSIGATYGYYAAVGLASLGGTLAATALFAVLGELVNRPLLGRQIHAVEPDALTHTIPSFDPNHEASVRARVMQTTAMRLKPMANFIYRSMQVGVLLVAAGTFLGGWWADKSWGRFWGWDPKEVWALIVLLVYLMPLHGRFAGWVNTFWLVISGVVCFQSVLMAWYGVNFVLGVGLHSYGFGSGEQDHGQLAVGVVSLVTLAFAGGAAWRRRISSQVIHPVA